DRNGQIGGQVAEHAGRRHDSEPGDDVAEHQRGGCEGFVHDLNLAAPSCKCIYFIGTAMRSRAAWRAWPDIAVARRLSPAISLSPRLPAPVRRSELKERS